MNKRYAALLMAPSLLIAALLSQSASAFCIYNEALSPVIASQNGVIGGLSTTIPAMSAPGEVLRQLTALDPSKLGLPSTTKPVAGSACCNWENKQCNPTGNKSTKLSSLLRVQVKTGTNIGVGRTGGEGYTCGATDRQGNISVEHQAAGWVIIEPNPKFKKDKDVSWRNPPFIAKVYSNLVEQNLPGMTDAQRALGLNFTTTSTPRHVKTYPCPAAVPGATWSDLIPDWSDVIAG
jgi:hypothetical protein